MDRAWPFIPQDKKIKVQKNCSACVKTFSDEFAWDDHYKSFSHRDNNTFKFLLKLIYDTNGFWARKLWTLIPVQYVYLWDWRSGVEDSLPFVSVQFPSWQQSVVCWSPTGWSHDSITSSRQSNNVFPVQMCKVNSEHLLTYIYLLSILGDFLHFLLYTTLQRDLQNVNFLGTLVHLSFLCLSLISLFLPSFLPSLFPSFPLSFLLLTKSTFTLDT